MRRPTDAEALVAFILWKATFYPGVIISIPDFLFPTVLNMIKNASPVLRNTVKKMTKNSVLFKKDSLIIGRNIKVISFSDGQEIPLEATTPEEIDFRHLGPLLEKMKIKAEEAPTFSCLRCGKCCQNLIMPDLVTGKKRGLSLFPDEVKRLKKLARKLGVSLEIKEFIGFGRGRRKPHKIVAYQLAQSICPFYDENSRSCRIYEKRPLACRSYPLYMESDLRPAFSSNCTWVIQNKQGTAPPELQSAYDEEHRRLARLTNQNLSEGLKEWLYSLDKGWERLNLSET